MFKFTTTIQKFGEKGEKTGWSYIHISEEIAQVLIPGNKKSFRIKGFLDDYAISGSSLIPMGEGDFILPLNATIRKNIRKGKGAELSIKIEVDTEPEKLSEDFMACLTDEPKAFEYFNKLPASHQKYFSRWIESAKTTTTKTKRIVKAVNALAKSWGYSEMIRDKD